MSFGEPPVGSHLDRSRVVIPAGDAHLSVEAARFGQVLRLRARVAAQTRKPGAFQQHHRHHSPELALLGQRESLFDPPYGLLGSDLTEIFISEPEKGP